MKLSDLPDMAAAREDKRDNAEGRAIADAVTPLTREQAAVVSLYTGYLAGDFAGMHALAEHLIGGPVWTHEFASKEMVERLRGLCKPLFLKLVPK